MTTYAYRLTLSYHEVIAIEAALKHYKEFCAAKLSADPYEGPYWLHANYLDAVLGRLYSDTTMTSWNTF